MRRIKPDGTRHARFISFSHKSPSHRNISMEIFLRFCFFLSLFFRLRNKIKALVGLLKNLLVVLVVSLKSNVTRRCSCYKILSLGNITRLSSPDVVLGCNDGFAFLFFSLSCHSKLIWLGFCDIRK